MSVTALKTTEKLNTGLKDNARKAVATGLSEVLADTYVLYLKTHYYHWNVTGPHFQALHLMFEGQYTALALAVDEIAERIRALGFMAPGTFAAYQELSEVAEDKKAPKNAQEMVKNLLADNETVTRRCRALLSQAQNAGDDVTTDLMVRRMDYHEKTSWMLRSSLA
ncbi:MAG: DNA starvation/stationary phase protection protein [Alphaproteobacteria bacterium]|nr:DNA starvation/stationary phase protection protein [Alphaproteobacteria bacterium]